LVSASGFGNDAAAAGSGELAEEFPDAVPRVGNSKRAVVREEVDIELFFGDVDADTGGGE
jgi:hypothetical protein